METKRKRTQVEEQDRGIYDIKNEFKFKSKTEKGLTEDIVRQISKEKNEPEWMLNIRLESVKKFYGMDNPTWAPDLSDVNIDDITTYIRPDADLVEDWDAVPEDIKNTFDLLGIPEAEREK